MGFWRDGKKEKFGGEEAACVGSSLFSSAFIVKGAPTAENSYGFFDVLELRGLQKLLVQDAMVRLDKTILLRRSHMRELLCNIPFLQIVPHSMGDKLRAVVITQGNAFCCILLQHSMQQPEDLFFSNAPPQDLRQDTVAVYIHDG